MGFTRALGYAAALAAGAVTVPAAATPGYLSDDIIKGADLERACASAPVTCLNYASAFIDGHDLVAGKKPDARFFCIPAGVINAGLWATLRDGFVAKPEYRDMPAGLALAFILADAYPCAAKR